MREFHWSWPDLEATPPYVKRYAWDLLNIRRQAEQDANDRVVRESRRA